MRETHSLGLVLHGAAVHNGLPKLVHDGLMDCIALAPVSRFANPGGSSRVRAGTDEILYGTGALPQHDRGRVIRGLALRLRVDASQRKLLPHLLQELVDIPAVLGADRAGVWDSVEQVELLDGDGVDLVQRVDDWDVASAFRFYDVY